MSPLDKLNVNFEKKSLNNTIEERRDIDEFIKWKQLDKELDYSGGKNKFYFICSSIITGIPGGTRNENEIRNWYSPRLTESYYHYS